MSAHRAHKAAITQSIPSLTVKLYDSDSDIRYMSLADLRTILTAENGTPGANSFGLDYSQHANVLDGLLQTLNDPNGEVQNLSVKCLGPFVQKTNPDILVPMLTRLTKLPRESPSTDNSVAALAVREVVVSLPHPTSAGARSKSVQDAYNALSRVLIPRLVGQPVIDASSRPTAASPGLLHQDLTTGIDSSFLDVLIEVVKCFGLMLQQAEILALQKSILPFLENDKVGGALRKKAISALSALASHYTDAVLSDTISTLIERLTNAHLTPSHHKTYITLLGSMARMIPQKFGPHLKTLAPFVLSPLSQEALDEQMQGADEEEERDPQIDETREAALVAIESFLSSCPSDMRAYSQDCIEGCLRFLRYDPNMADDLDEAEALDVSEDMDGEEDFEMDEDFAGDGGVDDEDDISWKVRRGAAKAVNTLITTRSGDILESGDTYDRIARALVDCFKEAEESVRLEVLSTLALLVRKSDSRELNRSFFNYNPSNESSSPMLESRKRRRGEVMTNASDVLKIGRFSGTMSPEIHASPTSGLPANLARVGPSIVRGALKLLSTSSRPTKQALVVLLKDLVIVQAGTELDSLDKVLSSILDIMSVQTNGSSAPGSSAAVETSLHIETLQLLTQIAKTHSSKALQSHMQRAVSCVLQIINGKSLKVSTEALKTIEQLTMATTPPRTASDNKHASSQLVTILQALLQVVQTKNSDLAIRQAALHVLGVLLGRTSGSRGEKLITPALRAQAMNALLEASKNETMRYAAIKAIEVVAFFPAAKSDFEPAWFRQACLEIGAQLRKADRSLRAASLGALKSLLRESDRCHLLDKPTSEELKSMLLPLIISDDLHLLGPTLLTLASMIQNGNVTSLDKQFLQYLSTLVTSAAAVVVLDQLCALVKSAGYMGIGEPLMQTLLREIGVSGSPAVVGKVIGSLLVSGGNNAIGLSVHDFLKELKSTLDDKRKCLALAVLGEIGLSSGEDKAGSITPDLFFTYFESGSSETSLAAAIALGRYTAGAADAGPAVSAILERAKKRPQQRYLLLHSIKEFLLNVESKTAIARYKGALWDAVVSNAESEEHRTIGAECVASLAILDPESFLPSLQVRPKCHSSDRSIN